MGWCSSTVSNRRMHFVVSSLRGKLGGLYACGATFRYNVPLPNIFLTRLFSKTRLKRKDFREILRLPWAQAELDRLENLVGRLSSATIAKRLRRPESSVVNKLKRLGTSRRVRDGYTMRELELCLGEDHHKIAGWIKNGWLRDRLQGTRRHDGNRNDIHRIREKDILTFIRNYPQELNLGKVDQMWFLDLLLLRGREVPAAKLPRKQGTAEDDAAA